MKYNSEQLFEDILSIGEIVNGLDKESWRVYNYLLDLYYLKFGINLRLTDLRIQDIIKRYNEMMKKIKQYNVVF